MKAELNYSLRLRFFGQYLNSCDCGDHGESFRAPWDSRAMLSLLEAEQEQAFLHLRPLSQITDEEAIEVARMAGELVFMGNNKKYWRVERGQRNMITIREKYHSSYVVIDTEDAQILIYGFQEEHDISSQTNTLWPTDYLRSKGFAVPFMGHSIEDLVSAGWVKLIERTDKPE